VGDYRHGSSGLLEGAILSPRARREEAVADERARETLAFLSLSDIAAKRPSELPYGVQKQVEFARALMQGARLVLLDEPMAGMTQAEKKALVDLILDVRQRLNVSFLVVEHDMPVVMGMSDHIVVLDFGKKIAEGEPRQISQDEAVIAAYLGAEPAGETA
jgi:branched-chain amino acid transport system ATP-binding protein